MIGLRPVAERLRVVCLGAHPDDIEIGCGGTLLRLANRGDVSVHGVVVTGSGARLKEAEAALPAFVPGAQVTTLGLTDGHLPAEWAELKDALDEVGGTPADVVFAPRVDDAHQDHRLLGRLASTVWRDSLILHYEIPKWDGDFGQPNHYVSVDESMARRKVELLDEHFPTQCGRDWWDEEMFLGLMRLRGMECRSRYAEAFDASKVLLDLDDARPFGDEPSTVS